MKNRVILNGQGIPVVPADHKSKKIAKQVAKSDFQAEVTKITLSSFEMGIECGMEALRLSLTKAKEAGHQFMSLDDGIKLTEEVTKLCKENLPKV